MEAALGDGWRVVVDGLNNRLTDIPDPQDWGTAPARDFDGTAGIGAAVAREMPLDLVIVMLGTNDAKAGFDRDATRIAEGAMTVARIAAESTGVATTYAAPRVLVVAPPPFDPFGVEGIGQFHAGGDVNSAGFAAAFAEAGASAGIPVFDAGAAMGTSDGIDGVHSSAEDHVLLGTALAIEVRALLE